MVRSKRQKRAEHHHQQAAAELSQQDQPLKEGASSQGQNQMPGGGNTKAGAMGENGKDAVGLATPKKRFFRQRAHANVFSDHNLDYPISPSHMDWSTHYPAFVLPSPAEEGRAVRGPPQLSKQIEIADIGCGFGGLLIALSPLFPETLMIGMELRVKVLSYVTSRIEALRSQNTHPSTSTPSSQSPGLYQNISALRTNTMKHLPNFFHRAQLSHLFLCFPDPHFKARKHKARIVSTQLNAEYAYVMRPRGRIYVITDVEELFRWCERHFEGVGEDGEKGGRQGVEELWERVGEEDLERDPCVVVMKEETEEGKKVTRNGGRKFVGVWERKGDPKWPDEE